MGIQFACECGKPYRVSDKYAGHTAQCRHCSAAMQIPASTMTGARSPDNEPFVGIPSEFAAGPDASTVPDAAAVPDIETALPRGAASRPSAPRVLKPTGKKPALPSRTLFSEIKKSADTELVSSECYTLAGQPWTQVYAGFGGQLTNLHSSEHKILRLEVFHLRDPLGDYAILQPYDGSGPLPVEYVGWMQGCLPAPLALLKTSADRHLEVGRAIAGPLGALLTEAASKVQSLWAAIDGSQPPLVQAAQQNSVLTKNLHWDGEFKMGPLTVTHHLRWAAQAIPVDDENYLLVAAAVPRKKLIGLRFDLPWFRQYRSEFGKLVQAQRANECGEFRYVDPSVWLLGASEALQWVDLDGSSTETL